MHDEHEHEHEPVQLVYEPFRIWNCGALHRTGYYIINREIIQLELSNYGVMAIEPSRTKRA